MANKKQETTVVESTEVSNKEQLLALRDRLVELKITRISDLENMIANCND